MELRAGYKRTEVGVIPDDWDVDRLGQCLLCAPEYGINAAAVVHSDSLPTYIRITDITDDGQFSRENLTSVDHPTANRYLLDVGDLLFARTGASVGKSYLYKPTDGSLAFAGFLIRVKPNPSKLVSTFLAAYVQTSAYWAWVKTMCMRSGQPGISAREFSELPIPLPPVSEQQVIADAFCDCDALISSLNTLIAKKRDLMQGVMQQLLVGRMRLPGFMGDWDMKKLGAIAPIEKGQLITEKDVMSGPVPVIAGGKKPAYYHNEPNRTGKTITVSASGANAGYVGFFDIPIFASDCSTISENTGYDLGFLYWQLRLKQEAIFKMQSGGAQPHIHPADLRPLEIFLPDLLEQQAIACVLSDMSSEIKELEKQRDKTRALKQGMMQELLTGKMRLL